MAKFEVSAVFTASRYLGEIEAATEEEAEEKALEMFEEQLYASLCHQCAGEFDGSPEFLEFVVDGGAD
ncbi:hypothetical protein [Sporomusa aerivorans]|uniref:hypothetical protein n=1 Tax=Sporomusa aerivorans TaxID=204936 RepID=UPI00352B5E45